MLPVSVTILQTGPLQDREKKYKYITLLKRLLNKTRRELENSIVTEGKEKRKKGKGMFQVG